MTTCNRCLREIVGKIWHCETCDKLFCTTCAKLHYVPQVNDMREYTA